MGTVGRFYLYGVSLSQHKVYHGLLYLHVPPCLLQPPKEHVFGCERHRTGTGARQSLNPVPGSRAHCQPLISAPRIRTPAADAAKRGQLQSPERPLVSNCDAAQEVAVAAAQGRQQGFATLYGRGDGDAANCASLLHEATFSCRHCAELRRRGRRAESEPGSLPTGQAPGKAAGRATSPAIASKCTRGRPGTRASTRAGTLHFGPCTLEVTGIAKVSVSVARVSMERWMDGGMHVFVCVCLRCVCVCVFAYSHMICLVKVELGPDRVAGGALRVDSGGESAEEAGRNAPAVHEAPTDADDAPWYTHAQ